MKKSIRNLTIVAASTALMAGCANTGVSNMGTGATTGLGAGLGALAGAAIGHATGGNNTLRGAAIGAAIGAGGGYLWSSRMEQQKLAMQQATAGTPVQVSQTADNRLKINIPADAGFATNSATINASLNNVLTTLATTLNQNTLTQVSIVGHTDSTGSDAINQPLSQARADAAKNYLVAHGVAATRIATSGVAASQPVADNNTVAGRAANRRVEIFVAEPAPVAK